MMLILNAYVAISCVSFFLLQSYFDPSTVLLLCFSFLTLIGAYKRLNIKENHSKYVLHLLIIIAFNLLLLFIYFDSHSTISGAWMFTGVVIYGFSTYLIVKHSISVVRECGFEPKETLSLRFYLTVIVISTWLLIHVNDHNILNLKMIIVGAVIGIVAYAIPAVCTQRAAQKIGPANHSMIIGITPLIITIIEPLFTKEPNFDQHLFLSVCLSAIIVMPFVMLHNTFKNHDK